MTLDEAIEHAEWVAENTRFDHGDEKCNECSEEHRQLAEWLRELRRARMEIDLLKTLRDGFKADARKYKAENARLRELCADMWRDIPKTESCGWDSSANICTGYDECHGECALWYRMHDLGIEVER